MGSSNENKAAETTVLLQELVATLDTETLARILQELARGNDLDVARAMIRSIRR